MNKKQKKMTVRIILTVLLIIAAHFVPFDGIIRFVIYLGIYALIGYDILRKAILGIFHGQIFDENFLMAVATVGAFALAVYDKSGDYTEAIAVMLFYQIGELFQSYAVGKSRKNISSLMDIRPDYANIENGGKIEKVSPEEVEIGTEIIVQSGEKIPIDGVVSSGRSVLNTSALTGESLPKEVGKGDEVISGCINMTGVLKIKTTKEFGESAVSKILELVENSSSRKSKSENFISKFARYYTPAVCLSALALAILPPLVRLLFMQSAPQWGVWLYRALTFLVISCPCALVISVPLTFFAGIGGAGKEGILVKGSNYLEALSKTKYVLFDKTGTLTKGVFEVTAVHPQKIDKALLTEYAALAECSSSHPISKSLQRAYNKEIDRGRVKNIEEIGGYGVTAIADGINIAVGNGKLMQKIGVQYKECHKSGTVVHIAVNDEYAGHIVISDIVKPDSKAAIDELKKLDIKKTVMLTGDNKRVAESICETLGTDEFFSDLLPNDKVTLTEKMLTQKSKNEKLAFVGDGINDAPVLTVADIGIAMGGIGSDAAIEAADVVLMNDNPSQIPKAIKIAKKCMRIVYQNIVFALAVKIICLVLSTFGLGNMWFAIFADVGVMVIAVLNAIRALRTK